jgi:type IV secretory pathway protease TraF
VSEWSQLLDEVAELEPPATLRGRVFAGVPAGWPPRHGVRRGASMAAAAVGIACVIAALAVAAHSRRDRPAPAKSGPAISAMADEVHRVAVAYSNFVRAQTPCTKEAKTKADVRGCINANSPLRDRIGALQQQVVAIGEASSRACKKSADAYADSLQTVQWALLTLQHNLARNNSAGYRIYLTTVEERYVSSGADRAAMIDACP